MKLIDSEKLIRKLRAWDHNANAIPNYVWKCIKELENDPEILCKASQAYIDKGDDEDDS